MKLYSIDLFSGVGGLTQGLRKAGFQTKMAFEIDELASSVYKLNRKPPIKYPYKKESL